jgi:hypothetical protein
LQFYRYLHCCLNFSLNQHQHQSHPKSKSPFFIPSSHPPFILSNLIGVEALQVINRTTAPEPQAYTVTDAWVAHDNNAADKLLAAGCGSIKIDDVKNYYGPKVALFFAFRTLFSRKIQIPALLGLALVVFNW